MKISREDFEQQANSEGELLPQAERNLGATGYDINMSLNRLLGTKPGPESWDQEMEKLRTLAEKYKELQAKVAAEKK